MERKSHPQSGSEHPVERRRKQLGLTRVDLARLANTSRNYVADVEARRSSPTDRYLRKLAQALQCEPADLMDNPAERVA